jgi:hypothetical protein
VRIVTVLGRAGHPCFPAAAELARWATQRLLVVASLPPIDSDLGAGALVAMVPPGTATRTVAALVSHGLANVDPAVALGGAAPCLAVLCEQLAGIVPLATTQPGVATVLGAMAGLVRRRRDLATCPALPRLVTAWACAGSRAADCIANNMGLLAASVCAAAAAAEGGATAAPIQVAAAAVSSPLQLHRSSLGHAGGRLTPEIPAPPTHRVTLASALAPFMPSVWAAMESGAAAGYIDAVVNPFARGLGQLSRVQWRGDVIIIIIFFFFSRRE